MEIINVAILGLGTVGINVYKIIEEKKKYFMDNYNKEISIKYVYVRDVNKKRDININDVNITDNFLEIANDDSIAYIIECMGGAGTNTTFNMLKLFISRNKNIVMASKKCLAMYGDELTELAKIHNVQLRFDATVGGGIPIFHALKGFSGYDDITKVYGIVNASTNYVLSLSNIEKIDIAEAISMAQELGYAENDPSEDLDGRDAFYKTLILLKYGIGIKFDYSDIKDIRLDKFNITDIILSNDEELKQVFYAEKCDKKIKLFVGLMNVKGTSLSGVNYVDNIICLDFKFGGNRIFRGQGAGGVVTASVMVEDLIDEFLYDRDYTPQGSKYNIEVINKNEVII